VGAFTQIHENTQVDADTLIGEYADIGPGGHVGPQVLIGAGTTVGASCQFGPGVIVGPGCYLGNGVVVGPNAEIGPDCFVGDGTYVGQDTTVSFGANIGQNAIIDDGLFLASLAFVADGEHLSQGLFKCSEPLSGNYTGTASECQDAGGVVFCPSDKLSVSDSTSSTHVKEPPGSVVPLPTDPCDPNTPDWVTEAIEDLKGSKYHDPCTSSTPDPNIPIPDRGYDPNAGGYTCGDFAHDAERGLSEITDPCDPNSKKYEDVTITYYWKYKPNPGYDAAQGDKKGNRKWLSDGAHALIDIHKDGKMVWLEPQTGGAPNPDLDFDDDGKVEYWDNPAKTKPNPPPDSVMSDDNAIIEVYPDRATAEKAGAPTG
jgi:carbonic anhydrase/acetyltransferase-like protein (isoleucine patch superfamily)